jgi:hypothetical protein
MHAPPPVSPNGALVPTRIGSALVVSRGTPLLGACVKCGAPNAIHRRTAHVAWAPPWVYLTVLISWLITVAAYYVTRQLSTHEVALCDACVEEWDRSGTERTLSAFAAIGSVIAAGGLIAANAVGAGVAMLLGGPIIGIAGILVASKKRLRAQRMEGDAVHLLGVDPSIRPSSPTPPLPPHGAPPWTRT